MRPALTAVGAVAGCVAIGFALSYGLLVGAAQALLEAEDDERNNVAARPT